MSAATSGYRFRYGPASAAGHGVPESQTLLQGLARCPREPDVLCYALRTSSGALCRAWLKLYHHLRIVGRENLPRSGPFVLVANHASHLDTLCLLAALPMHKLHNAYPAAAEDYFFTSVPRIAFAAICLNALPFGRLEHVRQSLALCREVLDAPPGDNILIVFPEGTRTTDGQIGSFRRGIGDLVAGSPIPVVPCHLAGTYEALPKGRWFPRPRTLTLRIGQARTFSHRARTKTDAIDICQQLRAAVIALGQVRSYESDLLSVGVATAQEVCT